MLTHALTKQIQAACYMYISGCMGFQRLLAIFPTDGLRIAIEHSSLLQLPNVGSAACTRVYALLYSIMSCLCERPVAALIHLGNCQGESSDTVHCYQFRKEKKSLRLSAIITGASRHS